MDKFKLFTISAFCILGLIILYQQLNQVQQTSINIPNESEELTEHTELTSVASTALSPLPPILDKWRVWPPDIRYAICRPKIYIYEIPSDIQISDHKKQRCTGSNYNAELILFDQLSSPNSSPHKLYVTENPEEADLFYIPFFGSCYLFNCWINNEWNQTKRCQVDSVYLEPLMNYIIQNFDYWNKTNGMDHFMIHPMDRSDNYYEKKEMFQNAIYLTIVGDKRNLEYQTFRRYNNIVIPSATPILNAHNVNPLKYVGENGNPFGRDIKGLFRGCCANVNATDAYSDGIRHVIFNGLKRLPGWDIEENSDIEEYAKLLARSKYGLTPSGWTLDTTRIWEYFAFGVVPIVIADGIIEPFEDDIDWDSMIVRVRRSDVHRINEILDSISEEEYQKKRERVWLIGKYLVINNGYAWHFIVRSFCRMLNIIKQELIDIEGYTYDSI
ncbi:glycosyltransferase family 47 protein [Gigaspora margarita]|uniref:Glycosyltransferase family 47 protein n=1 Tax=Gigaspora margarita TaxID=4874 RepID=A0A8H3X2F3_GIGMA|nr:glycosyltransferase family 47 protein [Gigaspora margarita]